MSRINNNFIIHTISKVIDSHLESNYKAHIGDDYQ